MRVCVLFHKTPRAVRRNTTHVRPSMRGSLCVQVSKFFPEESSDKFGDLWLIKYDDGDSEHMNLQEVSKEQPRGPTLGETACLAVSLLHCCGDGVWASEWCNGWETVAHG